jgi:hypothetical protein
MPSFGMPLLLGPASFETWARPGLGRVSCGTVCNVNWV